MSQAFRKQILDHLGHNGYRPVRTRDLERQMRVTNDESAEFRATIFALATEDFIDISADEIVRLTRYKDESVGKIRIGARGPGSGYFIPEIPSREGDLYVAESDTGGAVSGDRVRVAIVRRGSTWDRAPDAKPVARVIEVAPTGVFKGDAQVEEADISGRFEGTLVAREKVTVRSKGRVSGEIRYGTIVIESGGEISGAMQTLAPDKNAGAPASPNVVPGSTAKD